MFNEWKFTKDTLAAHAALTTFNLNDNCMGKLTKEHSKYCLLNTLT